MVFIILFFIYSSCIFLKPNILAFIFSLSSLLRLRYFCSFLVSCNFIFCVAFALPPRQIREAAAVSCLRLQQKQPQQQQQQAQAKRYVLQPFSPQLLSITAIYSVSFEMTTATLSRPFSYPRYASSFSRLSPRQLMTV